MPVTKPPPLAGRPLRRRGWTVLALGLLAAAIVHARSAGDAPEAAGYRIGGGCCLCLAGLADERADRAPGE